MTASLTYTALHQAFELAAHRHRTRPLCARAALAVCEAGPDGLSIAALRGVLGTDTMTTERAIVSMAAAGMLRGRSPLTLSAQGRQVARTVVSSLRRSAEKASTEDAAPLRELIRSAEPVDVVLGATTGDGW